MDDEHTGIKNTLYRLVVDSLPILIILGGVFIKHEVNLTKLDTRIQGVETYVMNTPKFTKEDGLLLKSWATETFATPNSLQTSVLAANNLLLVELRQINEKLDSLTDLSKDHGGRIRDLELKKNN